MKISISDQIEEATRWVASAKKAAETNPSVEPRVDAAEAILLTLQVYEALLNNPAQIDEMQQARAGAQPEKREA